MISTAWRQLTRRRARSLALVAGIAVASVSFSLLTAAVRTDQARTTGAVRQNLRPAYDILVRPKGSATALERTAGLVRDNYLSGIFGGISLAQYHRVTRLPGVAVAAPIAMVGYILANTTVTVPIKPALLKGTADEVFAVSLDTSADSGLSRLPPVSEGYVYVTSRPVGPAPTTFTPTAGGTISQTEKLADGRVVKICPTYTAPSGGSPFSGPLADTGACFSRRATGHPIDATFTWSVPVLVAAIDPVQEQKLVKIGGAVVSGRYLSESDGPVKGSGIFAPYLEVPVLASDQSYVDDTYRLLVSALPAAAASVITAGLSPDQIASRLAREPAHLVQQQAVTASTSYQQALGQLGTNPGLLADAYWTVGQVGYQRHAGGALAPRPQVNSDTVWSSAVSLSTGYVNTPIDALDTNYRTLKEIVASNSSFRSLLTLHSVGTFDPGKLPGFSAESRVPLQTYYPPSVTGANSESTRLLGGQPLLPDANPAGYLQAPPLIVTTLRSLPAFDHSGIFSSPDAAKPISVIRVRVGHLRGTIRQQLNQVAQVALEIRRATGLTVDVTAGSSPTTTRIALPAGKFGRPPLVLRENWIRKGVALVILAATDRESVALFGLILLITAFFLGNGISASARARQGEIGLLRALGWPARSVLRLILTETAILGLVAGVASSALSALLVAALALRLPADRIALVAPVALVLALAAAVGPAWRASRGQPMDAIRPAVSAPRRARPIRSLRALAVSGLRRRPGRALVATSGLAIGIAALTILLAITSTYGVDLGTSSLGSFVVTQARPVDYLSAGLVIALAAISVADVVYLNLSERRGEFATLAACGWQRRHLSRVGLGEGIGIGLAGALTGAIAGLVLAATAFGQLGSVITAAVVAAVAGLMLVSAATVTTLAIAVPRQSLTSALADEE